MASTGDDSDTSSLDSSSSSLGPSADTGTGAKRDVSELEEAQHDPTNENQETRSTSSEDDEELDSEEYERENRFQGPASTWRYFTENERTLAKSLDQQRANDLSIALYNVHALKTRVRDPDSAAAAKPYHSKKRWIRPNEYGTLPWQPRARWTAWPLRPGRVPRSGERFGVLPIADGFEDETYRKTEPWKPSGSMDEEILAIAMKKVKERLRANGQLERSMPAEDVEISEQPSNAQYPGSVDDGSNADVSMVDASDGSVEVLPASLHNKSKSGVQLAEDLLVDDDAAMTVFLPYIRHLLTQLDGLLMGLHKSRQGQRRTNSRSRSRSRQSRSASRAAMSSSRSKSRRRKPSTASEEEIPDDDELQPDEADEETEADNKRPKRRRRLNPRDWSEVLGMAAFTGFDPKLVDRAATRCTTLFGEGMDFKTVPLNSMTSSKSKTRTYGSGIGPPATTPGDDGLGVEDKPSLNWCYCPVTTCARHEEPFEKAFRWREHMKRSHKYSNARLSKLEADLNKNNTAASANAYQQEDIQAPTHTEADGNAGATKKDPLLQPIAVRMGRGKDKQPRTRKVPQAVQIESDEEEGVEMEE